MDIVIKAAQLILSLSILVIIHEFGHYTFAKLFKTRVEKFYLFFDPWFSIFKIKKGDTEYGIGWVPLGGYVKISGMIDESMDKEAMKLPPQPYEFRSKPAYQRLLIMVGGVMFNFILACFIYIGILFYWGEEYLPTANLKDGIWVTDSIGFDLGLKNGDKILSVSNKKVEDFKKIIPELLLNSPKTLQIERNGEKSEILFTDDKIAKIINLRRPFFEPRIPFIVFEFSDKLPAEKAGIKIGDKIIGINQDTVLFFDEFKSRISNYKKQDVTFRILRDGKIFQKTVSVSETGTIGVRPSPKLDEFYTFKKIEYGLFASIPAGIAKGYNEVKDYIKQLRLIFTPKTEAYKSVGSFITIGSIFPSSWVWYSFWTLTALLSIMLAVVNLLPIPALDGGHVLFLLFEIITRRKPSEKFLEYAQIGGMIILFALIFLALGNDIFKFFIK